MRKTLKPYEAYEETNLEWVEKIPDHWKVIPNKSLWFERKETNLPEEPLLAVTIKRGVIPQQELLSSTSKKDSSNADKSKYKLVKPDDIAYNKMRMWQGAVGMSKYRGIVSPAYIILNPRKDINARYYHFLLRTPEYVEESHKYSYGICDDQLSLRYEDFKSMLNIEPPKEEQDQIVRYLDHKLTKINRFIKAKKKQIELLKEQIDFLLFNDNESERTELTVWENSFPNGWTFEKVSRIFHSINIKNQPDKELLAVTQDRGILYKKDCEQNYVSPGGSLELLKLVRKNDYVISLRSFQGGIEHSELEGIVSPAYHVFSLNEELCNQELITYYKYLFKSKFFITQLNMLISDIRDGKMISFKDLSKLQVPMPPKEHLQRIMQLTKTYEKSNRKYQKENSLLTEYLTSLISSVVTGKVDVRHIDIDDELEGLEENLEDISMELDELDDAEITEDEIMDEETA